MAASPDHRSAYIHAQAGHGDTRQRASADEQWHARSVNTSQDGCSQSRLSARVASRHYLASEHLWSAQHQARLCADLEIELKGTTHHSYEHTSWAIGAAFSTVVFLEALVNEVFQDASDEQRNRLGALDDLTIARMGGYWLAGEQRSMLAKYQAGLTFAKAAEFETGASPYQDVSLLTKARNALVHFRPETVAEDDIMDLQRKLAGRFDDNALLAGTGNPWFHSKMLGAGFALWATAVSLDPRDGGR